MSERKTLYLVTVPNGGTTVVAADEAWVEGGALMLASGQDAELVAAYGDGFWCSCIAKKETGALNG